MSFLERFELKEGETLCVSNEENSIFVEVKKRCTAHLSVNDIYTIFTKNKLPKKEEAKCNSLQRSNRHGDFVTTVNGVSFPFSELNVKQLVEMGEDEMMKDRVLVSNEEFLTIIKNRDNG